MTEEEILQDVMKRIELEVRIAILEAGQAIRREVIKDLKETK